MKKWLKMLGLAVGVSMIISACGGNSDNAGSNSGSGNSGSGQSASTGETKSFTIKATNWDFEPKEIRVNKGDTVEIKLINEEGLHDILIKGYDKTIKDNETVTFTADKAGEFEFICNIFCGAGHDDMIGKLIVE